MTTILSFTCEKFSIILTDNRINHGPNQELGYNDNIQKLFSLDNIMGWTSGAGLSDFLEELKKELVKQELLEIQDIQNIYERVRVSNIIKYPFLSEIIDKSVSLSSWLSTVDGKIDFSVGILCKEHLGSKLIISDKNLVQIVYPGDYLNDQAKINELENKYILEHTDCDFDEILKLMLEIFKEISNNSKQVSSTCDGGVLTLTETGICKFKISGEIDFLLEGIEQKDIDKFIQVIQIREYSGEKHLS